MTHAPKNSAVILFRLVLECGRMKLLTVNVGSSSVGLSTI